MSSTPYDLPTLNARELVEGLRNRKFSETELLSATIQRIQAYDKTINAVVVRDFDRAYEAAQAADICITSGSQKPLLGLPITVKEYFSVVGLKTSWGNVNYNDWQPQDDSLVVSRLKRVVSQIYL